MSCPEASQEMYRSMGSTRSISRRRPMAVMRTSLAASLRAAMSSRCGTLASPSSVMRSSSWSGTGTFFFT